MAVLRWNQWELCGIPADSLWAVSGCKPGRAHKGNQSLWGLLGNECRTSCRLPRKETQVGVSDTWVLKSPLWYLWMCLHAQSRMMLKKHSWCSCAALNWIEASLVFVRFSRYGVMQVYWNAAAVELMICVLIWTRVAADGSEMLPHSGDELGVMVEINNTLLIRMFSMYLDWQGIYKCARQCHWNLLISNIQAPLPCRALMNFVLCTFLELTWWMNFSCGNLGWLYSMVSFISAILFVDVCSHLAQCYI